jgi:hypothetical protein
LYLLTNDVVAQLDALVANKYRWTSNKLFHFVLALAAERTIKQFLAACFL